MSQNRKLSVPADNPLYWQPEGPAMAGAGDDQTSRLTVEEIGDLEPSITTEVVQSLLNIEKLAGKQGSTKAKTKRGLGSSLRRSGSPPPQQYKPTGDLIYFILDYSAVASAEGPRGWRMNITQLHSPGVTRPQDHSRRLPPR